MPAQNDTELISFEGWTARVRPALHPPARLLLLIHGFKGDENSMWVFARDLSSNYFVIAPRAPYPVADGGFSWRPLQDDVARMHLDSPGQDLGPAPSDDDDLNLLSPEMFEAAVNSLLQFVDSYGRARGVDTAQFDVMGFSQGGVMTSLLALLHPQRVRKAAILAGLLPKEAEPLIARRPLAGKPLFMAHGTRDEKIPVDHARRSMALLEQAGADISYCEDDVGHKLSVSCLRALQSFLQD